MRKVLLGLLVVLATTFFFASCASKTEILQKAVEKVKADGGMPKTEAGITMDVAFDAASNTITYSLDMPEQVYGSMKAMAAQPTYKDFFMYSNKDNEAYKQLAKLLLDVNGKLQFTYACAGGAPFSIEFGADYLKKLVDGTLTPTEMPQVQQPESVPAEAAMQGDGEGVEMDEE